MSRGIPNTAAWPLKLVSAVNNEEKYALDHTFIMGIKGVRIVAKKCTISLLQLKSLSDADGAVSRVNFPTIRFFAGQKRRAWARRAGGRAGRNGADRTCGTRERRNRLEKERRKAWLTR